MYGKLFESTFTGSMYGKGAVTFATWGYAIAHTKPDGLVELNAKLISAAIGCKAKDVQAAIDFLCSPDPSSRTKTEDGKRLIREGEFLYRVVNHTLYNSVRNEPQRREYNRLKKRESRARLAANGQPMSIVDSADGQARQPLYAVSVSVKEEEAAALGKKDYPKDMDVMAENHAFIDWCLDHSVDAAPSRWRNWVLRAKESGRYAKAPSRPPTKEEILAVRRAIVAKQKTENEQCT
jgi:hypothetical protein